MTVVHAEKGLSGPALVQAFMGELSGYLLGAPDVSLDGTPQEIVETVVRETDRFANCSESAVHNLSRQLVMSIKAHGRRYGVNYRTLSTGRVQVTLS